MLWKTFLFLCLAFVHSSSQDLNSEWKSFKATYNKQYSSPLDEMKHKSMFASSLKEVMSFNSEPHSYQKGVNEFSDYTPEERKSMINSGVGIPDRNTTKYMEVHEISTKQDDDDDNNGGNGKDWRTEGAVSKIKHQGQCGSCWAFATVAALESQQFIQKKVKKLTTLSEGHLVDCYQKNCQGQYCWEALKYIKKNGGIPTDTAKCYPYKNSDGKAKTCTDKKNCYSGKINGHKMVQSEEALLDVVGNIGPVSIQMCVPKSWFDYSSGVYDDEDSCKSDEYCPQSQHAVAVVGYGTDSQDGDYWILKNSWGDTWGEKGYMRCRRGKNLCGIGDWGVYATFSK